jgi:hypothetical protein
VYSGRSLPVLQRNIQPPSSASKNKLNKQVASNKLSEVVNIYQTTWDMSQKIVLSIVTTVKTSNLRELICSLIYTSL